MTDFASETPYESGHSMTAATVQRLLAVNRRFYDEFAGSFAASRGIEQAGLQRAIAYLPAQGPVLDVGCGNGRLAHVLDAAGRSTEYLGIDSSVRLLEIARSQSTSLRTVRAEFALVDVVLPGWVSHLPGGRFQGIAAIALLHHLPGWQTRCNVLQDMHILLDAEGTLVVSAWQFAGDARLQRKVVPWSAVDLREQQVEAGDVLVGWQRGGSGLRYCHMIDEAELHSLARATGYVLADTYYADGRSQRLNLFAVLRPAPIG